MPSLQIVKQPYEVCFSRNPVLFRFKITPYGDDEAATNTIISCSLFAESAHYKGDFQQLKQVTLRPDADGFAEIDWRRLLDAQLEFYVPKAGDKTIQECTSQGVRYYVRYSLVNDYEQAVAPVDSDILNVIKGGIAYEQWTQADFFEQKIIADKEFLRYGYDGETAAPDEPLYVYFLDAYGFVPNSIDHLIAYVSISVQPGNTLPVLQAISIGGGGKWQVYCVAIGFTQQDLASLLPAGDFAEALFVIIEHPYNSDITKLLRIDLDYRNRYETRTLHYHNSLGGLDTQVMRGQVEISGLYDKQSVTLLDSGAYAQGRVLKAIARYSDAKETAQLKGDTGWIPQARAERLRDLLNANVAWELVAGGRLKPVQLSAKSVKLYTNTDKLYSLAADWQDAFADPNFTPDGYLTPASLCPPVEYLDASQEVQAQGRVTWQLPEGYDQVEIRFSNTSGSIPVPNVSTQFFVGGNSGFIDLPMPYTNINSDIAPMTIYFWARVICDGLSTPVSAGAWKGPVSAVLTKYVAPALQNVYVKTYKGSGTRLILPAGNTMLSYARQRNTGTTLALSLSSTGSAGGSFTLNVDTTVSYTPPYAGFSGIDILNWQAAEQIYIAPVLHTSAIANSKIYVTVDNNGATGLSLTGKVYVQLIQKPGRDIYINGQSFNCPLLYLYFFKDPLGTVPYEVTSLGLVVTLSPHSAAITYTPQTFSCAGTSIQIINQGTGPTPPLQLLPGLWMPGISYSLIDNGLYHIL